MSVDELRRTINIWSELQAGIGWSLCVLMHRNLAFEGYSCTSAVPVFDGPLKCVPASPNALTWNIILL